MNLQTISILGYLAFINMIALIMFGLDKRRARKGQRRISEAGLFLASLLGGVWGGILGMMAFRHKTRKAGFKAVMIVILLINIATYYYLAANSDILEFFGL